MTGLEQIISEDLAALANDSKRGLPELNAALPADAGVYRDSRPGAEARRNSLLDARRLELAMMPLAFERTFVHRVSRAAAGAVGVLAALTIAVTVSDPFLSHMAALLLGLELNLTVVACLTGIALLSAYVIGGWIAERVYDRRIRRSLRTTGPVYSDLDALSEGPIAEARRLLAEIDGWSVALPLLAVATLTPLFALLTLLYGPFWGIGFARFVHEIGSNLVYIGLGIGVGIAGAIALGRACQKEHLVPERPRLVRILGHWAVIPASFALGLGVMVVLGQALHLVVASGLMPSENLRSFLSVAGSVAVFAPFAWIVLWLRRRETRAG